MPLLIKFPGNRFSGQTIDDMVQLVDLFPTIVDAVGLNPIPHLDGKSLIPLLEGAAAPETSVADVMATTQLGVRTPHAKMLVNLPHLEPEYYQLDADAEEACDLAAKHEEAAQCVRKRYARILNNTGWVITLYPGREAWNTDLIFQLPHGVASLMEIFGLETLDFERDQKPDFPVSSNGASASLCITQPYRMFIRPVEGRNPLVLSLDSTTDFEVFIGRREVLRVKHFESVLDLHEHSFDRPPRLPRVPREDPAIVVWYGTYDSAASQTTELSDELIENLKSQGYLK